MEREDAATEEGVVVTKEEEESGIRTTTERDETTGAAPSMTSSDEKTAPVEEKKEASSSRFGAEEEDTAASSMKGVKDDTSRRPRRDEDVVVVVQYGPGTASRAGDSPYDVQLSTDRNRLSAVALLRSVRGHEWAKPFFYAGLTDCCRRLRDGRYDTLRALDFDVRSTLKDSAVLQDDEEVAANSDRAVMARALHTHYDASLHAMLASGTFLTTHTTVLNPPLVNSGPSGEAGSSSSTASSAAAAAKRRKTNGHAEEEAAATTEVPRDTKTEPPPEDAAEKKKKKAEPGPPPPTALTTGSSLGTRRRPGRERGQFAASMAALCEEGWLAAVEVLGGDGTKGDEAKRSVGNLGRLFCELDANVDQRKATLDLYLKKHAGPPDEDKKEDEAPPQAEDEDVAAPPPQQFDDDDDDPPREEPQQQQNEEEHEMEDDNQNDNNDEDSSSHNSRGTTTSVPAPSSPLPPLRTLNSSGSSPLGVARGVWLPLYERLLSSLVAEAKATGLEKARKRLPEADYLKLKDLTEREERTIEAFRSDVRVRLLTDRQIATAVKRMSDRHAHLAQILLFRRLATVSRPRGTRARRLFDELATICASQSYTNRNLQAATDYVRSRIREAERPATDVSSARKRKPSRRVLDEDDGPPRKMYKPARRRKVQVQDDVVEISNNAALDEPPEDGSLRDADEPYAQPPRGLTPMERLQLRELRVVRCTLLLARRHLFVAYLDDKLDRRIPLELLNDKTATLLAVLRPWASPDTPPPGWPHVLPAENSDDDTSSDRNQSRGRSPEADDDEARRRRRRQLADFQPLTMADIGLGFVQLRLRNPQAI